MATLTNQERNTLRKTVRLLDMRENAGQASYDQTVQTVLSSLREMLQPTDKFVLHVPEVYAFEARVAWYEISSDGTKHLFLQIIEPDATTEEQQDEAHAEGEPAST